MSPGGRRRTEAGSLAFASPAMTVDDCPRVEGIFEAGDVTLQSGVVMRSVRVAYEVHGKMNAEKTNLVLHPTSFGAQSADLRYRIGPGEDFTLDTSVY